MSIIIRNWIIGIFFVGMVGCSDYERSVDPDSESGRKIADASSNDEKSNGFAAKSMDVTTEESHGGEPGAFSFERKDKEPKAPAPNAHQYPAYPQSGVYIGQGWNSFRSNGTTAACVEAEEIPLETRSFRTNAREVKSSLSIFKENSVSIAASYSGFGTSGSASFDRERSHSLDIDKFHFLFEFESQASSTFAVPRGTVKSQLTTPEFGDLLSKTTNAEVQDRLVSIFSEIPQYGGGMFVLTSKAQTLLDESPSDFARVCGQGFVSAIYRGSKLSVLVSSSDKAEETEEKTKTNVSGRGYGASVNISTAGSEKRTDLTATVTASVYQEGGYPIAPPRNYGELDGIFENVDLLLDKPNAYRIRVTSYEDLVPDSNSKWARPMPPEIKEMSDYFLVLRDVEEFAANKYRAIVTAKGKNEPDDANDFVVTLADAYSKTRNGESYMRDLVDEITMHRSFIEKMIDECYENIVECGDFRATLSKVNKDIHDNSKARLRIAKEILVTEVEEEFREIVMAEFTELKPKVPNPPGNVSVTNIATISPFRSVISLKSVGSPSSTATTMNAEEVATARQEIEEAVSELSAEIKDDSLMVIIEKLLNNDKVTLSDELRETLVAGRDLIAEANERYGNYEEAVEFYKEIDSPAMLIERYYPKIYGFLARIPIDEDDYDLSLTTTVTVTSRSWKHGKYRKTEIAYKTKGQATPQQDRILADPSGVLQDMTIVQRLVPWQRYFCNEKTSHALCLSLVQIEQIAGVEIDEQLIKDLLTEEVLNYSTVTYQYTKKRRGGLHRL